MSVILTSRVLQNRSEKVYVDISNGNTLVTTLDGYSLFRNTGNHWEILDLKRLTRLYSQVLKAFNLNAEQVFYNQLAVDYSRHRATVLNDNTLYKNIEQAHNRRYRFFNEGIPFIIDPVTERVNNRNGIASTSPIIGSIDEPTLMYTKVTDAPADLLASLVDDPDDASGANGLPLSDFRDAIAESVRTTRIAGQSELGPDVRLTQIENSSIKTEEPDKVILRYPLNNPEGLGYQPDYLHIGIYQYERSIGGSGTGSQNLGGSTLVPAQDGSIRFSKLLQKIILPMVPNIQTTNSVGFGEDKINPLALEAGALLTGQTNLGELQKQFLSESNLEKGSEILNRLFAGKAVGQNLVARASGGIINPNMELLFTGPKMRSVELNFRLTPRFEKENDEIKEIIRVLKMHMSPQRQNGTLFLKTPDVFQLQYIDGETGKTNPNLPKFRPAALTSFTSNFTPDGSYMTYDDGGMTAYQIRMTFEELMPLYKEDYKGTKGSVGW